MNAIDVNDIKSNASNINFSNYAPNYAASSGMIRSINTNIPCSNTCVSSYAVASNVENMNFDDIESIKQDKNILEKIKKSELVTGYDSKLEKLEKEKLEISSLIASKNVIITMPTYAASSNVYKYSDIEKLKAEVLELQKQLDVKNAEIKEVEQMKNATVNYLAEMYYKNLESNPDFQDNIKINLTEEEANQLSLIYSKLYEARVYDSSFNQMLNKDNFCNYDIVRNLYENNPSLFDGIDWDIVKNAYDKGFNIYEVAMQSPSLMEESLEKSLFLAGDDFSFGNFLHLLNFMTEEERNMVMYLYNTEGDASVKNYLSFKQEELNYREGYYNASKFLENINNSTAVGAFFKTVDKGLGDGVGTFFEGLESAFGGMDGVVSVKQAEAMYIISGMSEEQIDEMEMFSEEEKEKLKQLKGLNSNMFLQGTYEISSSIGNMIPSMAVSAVVSYVATPAAGAKVGATLMGISAGGNAAEGMYQQGHGFYESVFYGIMSGGSEMALGYLLGSIPGLSKGKEFVGDIAIDVTEEGTKKLFKETLKEIGKDILSEGGEEALQAIIDPYLQSIALGVEPEIDWNEVVKSGIYGMITAGMLNGGTVVYKGTKIKVETLMNNAALIKAAQDLGIEVDYTKINSLEENAKLLLEKVKSVFSSNSKTFDTRLEVASYFNDSKQYLYQRLKEIASTTQDQTIINFYNQIIQDNRAIGIPGLNGMAASSTLSEAQIYNFMIQNNLLTSADLINLNKCWNNKQNLSQTEKNAIFIFTAWAGPHLAAYSRNAVTDFNGIKIYGNDEKFIQNYLNLCTDTYNKIYKTNIPYMTVQQYMYILDNIISKNVLTEDVTVYRGVDKVFYDGNEIELLKKGTIINDPAFLSTSMLKTSQQKKHKYCIKIVVPKGTPAAYIESFTGVTDFNQQELLLGRNTSIQITGHPILNESTGIVEVQARVVSSQKNIAGSNPFQHIPNITGNVSQYSNMYGINSGIGIEQVVEEMQQMNLMERFNSEVDDMIMRGLYYGNIPIAEHDISHVKNVLLYSMYMGGKMNLSEYELNILIEATKYHDTGIVESEHKNHAIRSSSLVANNLINSYSSSEVNIIRAIIEYHESNDSEIELNNICNKLGLYSSSEINTVRRLSNILKDADALDRTRFPGNLNTQYLRNKDISNPLVLASFQLREQMATNYLNDLIQNQTASYEVLNLINNPNIPRFIIYFSLKYYRSRNFRSINDYVDFIMCYGKF